MGNSEVTTLIQTLGFPIAIALALLYFAWKVYQNMTRKIDEKDRIIQESSELRREFQNKLIDTQNSINDTLRGQHSLMQEMKEFLFDGK